MQDLASEFSNNFTGVIPLDHHSERGWPPAFGRARGASAPVLRPNLGLPQLFSMVAPL